MDQFSSQVDMEKLVAFAIEQTDKKNAEKNEVGHFTIGRLLVVNSLNPHLTSVQQAF